MSRVIIVGGGVIGAACAYYLSASGRQVTIVERGAFGKGCSHANCGFVCPSHVLPLAMPGAVSQSLKAMVSALAIRRISDPAETAAVVAFLASPAASYITGAVIDSNGEYTA